MIIDYKSDAIKFRVGEFVLFFPTNIKFETFNNPQDNYGIVFDTGKIKYQVLDSKLGARLLINGREGECRDIPFNIKTISLLPDFVKVKVISDLTGWQR